METDEAVLAMREDEELREKRWNEFVAWVRSASVPVLLRSVADIMSDQRDPWYIQRDPMRRILDFQEAEGWPAVLSAIARAMREQEGKS